jgi:hypothetical protein
VAFLAKPRGHTTLIKWKVMVFGVVMVNTWSLCP